MRAHVPPGSATAATRLLAVATLVALAGGVPDARAQLPVPPVKTPGAMVTEDPPGQYNVRPGDTITWVVAIDNAGGASDLVLTYVDVMDGVTPCGPGVDVCPGSARLELLCPPAGDPWAPDPTTGTLTVCDPATGWIEMAGVTVPAGGVQCLRFSTRVDPSATEDVANVGCLFDAAGAFVQATSPPTDTAPHCAQGLPGLPRPECSIAHVTIEPPILVSNGNPVVALTGGSAACGPATTPAEADVLTTPCGTAPDLAQARIEAPVTRASLASGSATLPGEALALSPFETDAHGDVAPGETVLAFYGTDAVGTLRLDKRGDDVVATLLP